MTSDITLVHDGEYVWAAKTTELAEALVSLGWQAQWRPGEYEFTSPDVEEEDDDEDIGFGAADAYSDLCNSVNEAVDQDTIRLIDRVKTASYPGVDPDDQAAYDALDPALVARVNNASGFCAEQKSWSATEAVYDAFVAEKAKVEVA